MTSGSSRQAQPCEPALIYNPAQKDNVLQVTIKKEGRLSSRRQETAGAREDVMK